jgi:hypothetical protein
VKFTAVVELVFDGKVLLECVAIEGLSRHPFLP